MPDVPEPKAKPTISSVLLGTGSFLLGIAALLVASQWDRHPIYKVEMPRDTVSKKYGYSITTAMETNSLGVTRLHLYLVDRDTGRIWTKKENTDRWVEVNVESLTPSSSRASLR